MNSIKAKFIVQSVPDTEGVGLSFLTVMTGVYGGATNAEDNTFSAATPYARLEMNITNPDAKAFFKLGKKYYAVFTEAPED